MTRILRTTDYQLNIEIKQSMEEVFNYFSDLSNHVDLHPLLTKISLLKEFQNEKGQDVSVFKIQERIPILGKISISNTYTAHRILLEVPKTCIFEVKSFPWVYLSSSYIFRSNGMDRTAIQEEVIIRAPWGVSRFVTKTAKKAHGSLLTRLKQRLEDTHK